MQVRLCKWKPERLDMKLSHSVTIIMCGVCDIISVLNLMAMISLSIWLYSWMCDQSCNQNVLYIHKVLNVTVASCKKSAQEQCSINTQQQNKHHTCSQ